MNITQEQLTKRVAFWQKRLAPLGIGHFDAEYVGIVLETPAGPDAAAASFISTSYDVVRMWYKAEFLDDCEKEQLDQLIIHEWVHVALRDLVRTHDILHRYLPPASLEDFEDRVLHEQEKVIDRIANALLSAYSSET